MAFVAKRRVLGSFWMSRSDGPGFILGVDLDSCLDANGLPAEWAEDLIRRFGSYSGIRPSQTGAKIFGLIAGADLPVISAMIGGGHGRQ